MFKKTLLWAGAVFFALNGLAWAIPIGPAIYPSPDFSIGETFYVPVGAAVEIPFIFANYGDETGGLLIQGGSFEFAGDPLVGWFPVFDQLITLGPVEQEEIFLMEFWGMKWKQVSQQGGPGSDFGDPTNFTDEMILANVGDIVHVTSFSLFGEQNGSPWSTSISIPPGGSLESLFSVEVIAAVPEPTTAFLLTVGVLGLAGVRRKLK